MILVFGGTTEGKQVHTMLVSMAIPHIYSTKTKINFTESKNAIYRYGAFNYTTLNDFLIEKRISLIINASHPFAELLHNTIAEVAQQLNIRVIRFARKPIERTIHPLVYYVKDYHKAMSLLEENFRNNNLLALTGVQSIKLLKKWWINHLVYFRILDREVSLSIAQKEHFPKERLILGLPSDKLEIEIGLIEKFEIGVTLTKESGESGFLPTKIEAALKTSTSIIIIKSPDIPAYFEVVYDLKDLENLISLKPEKL